MRHRLLTYLLLIPLLCLAQSQAEEENYIRVSTYQDAAGSDSITDITYYDELGRESKQVAVAGSPTGYDLTTLTEYDRFGRVERKWLPVATPYTKGISIAASGIREAARKLYADDCPFSKNKYEDSPLERLSEQLEEGENWHRPKKAVKFYNTVNTQDFDVLNAIHFTVDKDVWNSLVPMVKNAGYYDNGSLHVTETTDEDGRKTYSFRDFDDKVILNRQLLGDGDFCDTYYIYDVKGKLLAVLPPIASDLMKVEGTEMDLSLELGELAYAYFYDYRGRCVCKKLPGTDFFHYVYDTTDTPVLYQTPWLRERGLWGFEITDSWGRVCLEGTCENNVDLDFLKRKPLPAVNALKSDCGAFFGYNITGFELRMPKFTKVCFYDDYLYLDKQLFPKDLAAIFSAAKTGSDVCDTPKGLLTGCITATLGTEESDSISLDATKTIFHSMYYDYKDRKVASFRSNLLGGYTTEQREYDYVGNLLRKSVLNKTLDNQDIKELYTYAYDKRGRLIDETHQLSGKTLRELEHNTYDAVGRLESRRRNKSADYTTLHRYNIRAWETEISAPRFRELLYYEQPEDKDATACFNGNISVMKWGFKNAISNVNRQRSYKYYYNRLDRLTNADYNDDWGQKDYYSTWYSYDKQGNQLNLSRMNIEPTTGKPQLIDDATFRYDGNKMLGYQDIGFESSTADITLPNNYEDDENQFAYDSSGNTIRNSNKGITRIEYNQLNLPERICFDNGQEIRYTYDANGNKLRVYYSGLDYAIDYDGHYRFRQKGTGKHVILEIDLGDVCIRNITSASPVYYYKLKEHLGSVRVVMGTDGTVSGFNNYYPYGGDFDTSGRNAWGNRFCDKEMDRRNGLDLYDSQARYQDPALGRFYTMDRKSEADYSVSPYIYGLGNPVNNLDDDGNSAWSKALKAGFRIGKAVSKNGLSALAKSATYADAVADIRDDFKTIFNSKASTKDRLVAGASLASEVLPVSIGDAKDISKAMTKLRKKAAIGQEAHRQIERELFKKGAKTERKIRLDSEHTVRKDAVKSDGTAVIIKPDTKSGHKSAARREKLMNKYNYKTEIIYYDPNDPKYLPNSPTYIGPIKINK